MKNVFKKILKSAAAICLTVFVLFGLTACKTPLSATTNADDKTYFGEVATNGGTTALYGDYLYFVNGTKTNDGTSSRGNTLGAIYKVEFDKTSGKIKDGAEAELVISDLVGFEDGSINIFGDFLYYTTPNASVNHNGKPLNGKTDFRRLDLVNGGVYTIYTTERDDSNEAVEYAYYVLGEDLYLMVFEGKIKSLKSLKIGDSTSQVYQISDVESCIFSDNFGKRIDADIEDANDFIFYTKAPSIDEEGTIAYKTLPSQDSSVRINDADHALVELLGVKNGKLVYSLENEYTGKISIYAQTITNDETSANAKLAYNEADIISRKAYNESKDMFLFTKTSDGNVGIVAYDSVAKQIVYKTASDKEAHTIIGLGADFSGEVNFVGMTTVVVENKNDGGEVVSTDKIDYLIYTSTASSKTTLYKLEIKRLDANSQDVICVSKNLEVIADADDGMVAINGLVMPETVGNQIYIMMSFEDKDENISGTYLHCVDISKDIDEDNDFVLIQK